MPKERVIHVKSLPTISHGRFEVCKCHSVDVYLPLLLSRVHKQSGAAIGSHLKEPTIEQPVLHPALCLIEGGPGHHHGTWHSCEAQSMET